MRSFELIREGSGGENFLRQIDLTPGEPEKVYRLICVKELRHAAMYAKQGGTATDSRPSDGVCFYFVRR